VFAFCATRQTLTWIVIGTVVAVALDPVVDAVQRRMQVRRGVAIGVVGAAVVGTALAVVIFLGPPAVREAQSFSNDLPGVVERLGELPIIGERLREANAPERVQEFIEELPTRLSNDDEPLVRIVESAFGGALAMFSVVLVTLVLLLDGHRIVQGVRRVVPLSRRAEVDRVADILTRTIGHYFAGSLFVAALSGLAMLVVGLILGVPSHRWPPSGRRSPAWSRRSAASRFVLRAPRFADSPHTGVLCLRFLVWQQIENARDHADDRRQAVDLSPPTTMMPRSSAVPRPVYRARSSPFLIGSARPSTASCGASERPARPDRRRLGSPTPLRPLITEAVRIGGLL
jgi:hypothetical protein